ncbi:hypothetical protein ACROYT_G003205 [Oculina patagonica]
MPQACWHPPREKEALKRFSINGKFVPNYSFSRNHESCFSCLNQEKTKEGKSTERNRSIQEQQNKADTR